MNLIGNFVALSTVDAGWAIAIITGFRLRLRRKRRKAKSTARLSSYFQGAFAGCYCGHAIPKYLRMSNYVAYRRFRAFQKQVRKTIIARINLFHINAAPTLWAQGQSTLSDDPALADDATVQTTARSKRTRAKRVRGSSSSSYWWLLLVGLIAAVLCLPFIRVVGPGDEGVLLNGAERILRGSRLYTDFFEFLPPGGFLLTAAWFSVAGISVGSVRALTILTIVGIACFTYLACRLACKNAPLSALLATGWVVMSQGI